MWKTLVGNLDMAEQREKGIRRVDQKSSQNKYEWADFKIINSKKNDHPALIIARHRIGRILNDGKLVAIRY